MLDFIKKTEKEINEDSFWDNNTQAQTIFNSLSSKKKELAHIQHIRHLESELITYFELAQGDDAEEFGEDFHNEYKNHLSTFCQLVSDLELKSLLSNPHDHSNAYLSIFAGAGGTDAQDWADMLLRMYVRWAEKQGLSIDILEQSAGDEAGIKSATCLIKGDLAYGYLKHEHGVHRLVRLSPFNANNKRQTSFAGIEIMPEIDNSVTTVSIDPKDLKIDTFRASGAGGQHVNKTDSAVRVTHLPTGLVATSQASRSQTSNKESAMSILKARLLRLMQEQKKEEISQLKGEQFDNSWGNQIRSYVLHPYKLVKDLRSNFEDVNVNKVLDGNLSGFIQAMLRHKPEQI